ncbi:MAG: DUF4198 domain-containing protein [Gemmataceae bacterium]|nr:DUF4198 domain-containing protein [Gemmataceae bacterium]
MRLHLFVGLVLVVVFGCSSKPYKVAPVSGRVTLNGKPLPKASVTFVPMATKENQNPGPTAQDVTDADGRFKVAIDPETPGAVVGKCRIYISTLLSDPDADSRDAGGPIKNVRDKVPEKYNQKTELVFDVPAAGTDQANFDLKSR